jgi:nitrite reductase (NADH) large subunit
MKDLLIVGGGMVSHRLVEALASRGATSQFRITLLTEEPRPPYDRVSMSKYFDAGTAEPLLLASPGWYAGAGVEVRLSTRVCAIDRAARTVTAAGGETFGYDALVLTTGSRPFVPPVQGHDAPGCFVYRALSDLDAIRDHVRSLDGPVTGVVIGGGLLGLEAAGALRGLGADTHVVELAPRLMPAQVDEVGGRVLLGHIASRGLTVHCGAKTEAIEAGAPGGPVARLRLSSELAGEYCLDARVVVFSAGIRPRDDLAAACGLPAGPRGGFLVDRSCRTPDPAIWAAGECAAVEGTTYGLVAPGYSMAEVVAAQLLGGHAEFGRPSLATKLKLLDVDVASFGDAHGAGSGAQEVRFDDPVAGTYSKLVVGADGRTLLGGILIGDAARYQALAPLVGRALPRPPRELIGMGGGSGSGLTVTDLPDEALICTCNAVDKGTICSAVRDGACTVALVKKQTKAGTGCGSCLPSVEKLRRAELAAAGAQVSDALCEHFPFSRAQLYDLVRLHGYRSFGELAAAHGQGLGCEICRPVVASILASRTGQYVLGGERAALQDTNDHLLANIQKNGTYSVVPRIPGGEISPARLAVLAAVAADFGLYVKITGAQRIDLLGARAEQLPAIWRRLIDAGFESGHAYGKSFRTMKSCVGSTWCRYGVQDSVGLAIRLELRYRGLRSPHKIKGAVSGCSRECAEAQGKDIGVIATEKGWNLYVGGNGGYQPQHAKLFAQDLGEETLIRYIDRVLLYYIATADRLERTASWLNRLDGGVTSLRQVVIDDSLGMCAEWDAHMQALADSYECEWKRTLEDPMALRNFVSFVNAPGQPDPDIAFVTERGQPRPLAVSLAGQR